MKRNSALYLTRGALIAALYVALSMLSEAVGLCSGVIQCRFSEALTILPAFLVESIPGLYIGCLITNLISGCAAWDIALGPIATLIGALGTYLIGRAVRKGPKTLITYKRIVIMTILFALPPILANMAVIPPVLRIAYGAEDAYWFLLCTVGAGEVIACGIFGGILLAALLMNPYTWKILYGTDIDSKPKTEPAEVTTEKLSSFSE